MHDFNSHTAAGKKKWQPKCLFDFTWYDTRYDLDVARRTRICGKRHHWRRNIAIRICHLHSVPLQTKFTFFIFERVQVAQRNINDTSEFEYLFRNVLCARFDPMFVAFQLTLNAHRVGNEPSFGTESSVSISPHLRFHLTNLYIGFGFAVMSIQWSIFLINYHHVTFDPSLSGLIKNKNYLFFICSTFMSSFDMSHAHFSINRQKLTNFTRGVGERFL